MAPFTVELPPVPSDIEPWATALTDLVDEEGSISPARPAIPLPASGVREGPIKRYLDQSARVGRQLRSHRQQHSGRQHTQTLEELQSFHHRSVMYLELLARLEMQKERQLDTQLSSRS